MFTEMPRLTVGVLASGLMAAVIFTAGVSEQSAIAAGPLAQPTPEEKPVFAAYRGISIGMSADDVRSKLDNPKDKSDAMDFYLFSDSESAQFFYTEKVVTAIMVTFSGDLKQAPTPMAVFGEDVAAKPDGAVFKMARYPKAGFWISYNRTAGDDAVVSIAMQKI